VADAENEAPDLPIFLRIQRLRLAPADIPVFVGLPRENLGFPGGVNSWMRLFLSERGWDGVWVLNPDTWPAPDALAELIAFAVERGKGMVQSRIMFPDRSEIASSRGLKWHKLRAAVKGVDIFAPVSPAPDPDDVERRTDSPTGVSFYVTRACIDKIGLMDESYWLYWEDFDWGVRAKAACGIGYAHNSIVPHIGGSSSGAVRSRAKRSVTAVYLGNRNKLHFVRQHHPRFFAWTVFVSFLRAGEYLLAGSTRNFVAANKGLVAGLRGEKGRPKFAPNQAKV
jgi:N-acetylglucosaminyl-diphospho-decaprenol L-rhamnosyltransferase